MNKHTTGVISNGKNLKSNFKYRRLLMLNLLLMIVPTIIFIIVLLTNSFEGDKGKTTTLIMLMIFVVLITINLSLLIILKMVDKNKKSLPRFLKIISIIIAIPVILGMIIRGPEYLKDLLE